MNIADKSTMYHEAFRVLKPGGRPVLCHINAGLNGPPEFPLPWAAAAEHSFPATEEETRGDLATAGFQVVTFRDTTPALLTAQPALRHKLGTEDLPAAGAKHILMGDRYLQLQRNFRRAAEDDWARTVEVVAMKPS